jgi:hypothetical protein
MRKPWLWLSVILLFAAAASVHAQNQPVVTFSGTTQTSLTYNGSSYIPIACSAPLLWGPPEYNRRGDFDGDGTLDAVSINPGSGWIYIKTRSGRSDNCTNNISVYSPASWGAAGFTWVADFNGDGKADIASANGANFYMKLSNPGAGFTGFTAEIWTPGGAVLTSAANTFVGDFNGDGRADIASANGGVVEMKLSRVDGDGRFIAATWTNDGFWGGASYIKVGDFDGDGRADLASPDGGVVRMKLSRDGYFDSSNWDAPISWGGPDYTWVADFNGDGRADIASANRDLINMLLSQGSYFSYGYGIESHVLDNWGSGAYTWVIDYDGDGDKDIVSGNGGSMRVKKNTGLGAFVDQEFFNLTIQWGGSQYTFALDRR